MTNNHKFILDKSKDAIYQHSGAGPHFGISFPDFYLDDFANSNNNSYAQINKSYTNENYIEGNGDSYMKFTGNPDKSPNFKAK